MILYETKYLQLKCTKADNGDNWYYAHRPNAKDVVVILPIINNSKVLFLKEKRPPLVAEGIAEYCIGLPAGLVGDERINESIEDAIRAELLEETGLEANTIDIKTKKLASSAGCVSEIITIAIAYIENYNIISQPVDDGGIIVDRIPVDIKDIRSWLKTQEKNGNALTASTLAALFYLEETDYDHKRY